MPSNQEELPESDDPWLRAAVIEDLMLDDEVLPELRAGPAARRMG